MSDVDSEEEAALARPSREMNKAESDKHRTEQNAEIKADMEVKNQLPSPLRYTAAPPTMLLEPRSWLSPRTPPAVSRRLGGFHPRFTAGSAAGIRASQRHLQPRTALHLIDLEVRTTSQCFGGYFARNPDISCETPIRRVLPRCIRTAWS